jgi:nucleotide-binding universal stress UspA family protein
VKKKQIPKHRRGKGQLGRRVRHLLIPVDVPNSPGTTRRLLDCARTLVGKPKGRITLLEVVEPMECIIDCGYGPVVRHGPNQLLVAKAGRRLNALKNKLAAQGQKAACVVLSGTVEEQIPLAAKSLKADAILVLNAGLSAPA